MPVTVLGTEDIAGNKTQNPCFVLDTLPSTMPDGKEAFSKSVLNVFSLIK